MGKIVYHSHMQNCVKWMRLKASAGVSCVGISSGLPRSRNVSLCIHSHREDGTVRTSNQSHPGAFADQIQILHPRSHCLSSVNRQR